MGERLRALLPWQFNAAVSLHGCAALNGSSAGTEVPSVKQSLARGARIKIVKLPVRASSLVAYAAVLSLHCCATPQPNSTPMISCEILRVNPYAGWSSPPNCNRVPLAKGLVQLQWSCTCATPLGMPLVWSHMALGYGIGMSQHLSLSLSLSHTHTLWGIFTNRTNIRPRRTSSAGGLGTHGNYAKSSF
jgi:hypothetical protein